MDKINNIVLTLINTRVVIIKVEDVTILKEIDLSRIMILIILKAGHNL